MWYVASPFRVLAQLHHPCPCQGLGQPDGVAACLADMNLVERSFHRGGFLSFGDELCEAGKTQDREDRHVAFPKRSTQDPVEAFGGIGAHGG